jgi:hypothetical protein
MKSVKTKEELIKQAKENCKLLIKFGDKNDLMKLQKGELYMKNLQYYNDLEIKGNSGKPDKIDGKWLLKKGSIIILDPKNNAPIGVAEILETVLAFGIKKHPVFCLFGLDDRNCGECTDDDTNITFHMEFTKQQKQKLEKGLGEYAMVVVDAEKFIKQITAKLKEEEIIYIWKLVQYNDGNSPERIEFIKENNCNIAFNKEKSDYEYQQEYRLFIINQEVEDHFIIDVGDLSDFTKIISTKQLINSEMQYSVPYESIY